MSKTGLTVELTEQDGNAMMIIGRCMRVLRQAGYDQARIKEFSEDAMSGDYDHLLQVVQEWFEVE